ncbi:ferrichrome receptor FiuA [Pigmentiphaga litoralis]|uniref:TonB-dependent siderophore receptor n=1 Tax=Pigmentiphaga litoralis TaxID=516702 RepID=UPI00167B2154|nr:TonB-dependent siderophore receptor [Pigmentiphaga litoralis]GGW99370.1 ferrichrome receptor FiuA [Pigmentiphaga litoralis]
MVHHRFTVVAASLAVAFPLSGLAQQTPADAPARLPAIQVEAAGSALADPVDTGYTATRVRSAMKSNTSLLETPQAVNVVTRMEMERQGSVSVAQALRYTPGVVGQYGDTDARYDWLTVRGFTPARYLDGLVLPFGVRGYAQPRVEVFGLERIEVLKGPSSGLFGQTAPGGLVNMVSKKPTEERLREVNLQYGSFDRKQAAFDFGGPVDENRAVLYRLTGLVKDSGTQYDYVKDNKVFLQGGLTFNLSDATRLNLMAQYQKIRSPGGGGAPVLPRVGTVVPSALGTISRGRFVGDPNYDLFTNEQKMLGYTLEHQLNDRVGFKQTARVTQVDTNSRRVQVGAVFGDTQAARYAWSFPEKATTIQIDNQLNADLDWGVTRHRITAGVDYLRDRADYTESQLGIFYRPGTTTPEFFDLYNPVYGDRAVAVPPDALRIHQTREQLGVYLQDQVSIDKWRLTLAGRQDWTNTDTNTTNIAASGAATFRRTDIDANRFTGRAALAYAMDNGVSPYVSYSTSFQPLAGIRSDGTNLKPSTGKQVEAGVKFQPANRNALLTAAVFDIKQDDVSATDPTNSNYSIQVGQVTSRGLELEAKGSVTKALNLTLAYTYMDTEITRASSTAASAGREGNRLNFVPRHQASVWADYTVQTGPLAGLGLGAGVRYRGSVFGDLANQQEVGGVTLVDAALRYDLGRLHDTLKGADLSVNFSNLFDKKYVVNCLAATACYWGTERTAVANLRYRW